MLDPQTKAFLDERTANPRPPIWELRPDEWRKETDELFALHGLPVREGVLIENRTMPGPAGPIPVRLYRRADTPPGPSSGLVYFHGGGMVTNSINTYDAICRSLCLDAECVVASVGYRLAPEHRFPAGVRDAFAAASWAYENGPVLGIDPTRLAVGGDSAGGYLTAVVTQLARERGWPRFAFQFMVYPFVGTRGVSYSMAEFATGYLFERTELDWITTQYLNGPHEAHDVRAMPALAAHFRDLPPAFVVTAGHDILRDDAEHYAELLARDGVPVELHRYESTIHPFLNLAGTIDAGRETVAEIAAKLRAALSSPPAEPPCRVEFENEWVRVVRVLAPHSAVPLRPVLPSGHPTVRIDMETGAAQVIPAGDTAPPDPVRHQLRVEIKAGPPVRHVEDSAVEMEPDRFAVEYEDEVVRLVRVRYGPGEQSRMVSHPPRFLVTLTDVHVRVELPGGRLEERRAPAGVAAWLDAETVRTSNLAAEQMEVLLVEPKQRSRPCLDEPFSPAPPR